MPARVLVTDAESRKALAVVRALGRDFEVSTLSASRISIAGWSRWSRHHFVVPPDEAYAERVLGLARDRIDIIIAPQEDTIIRLGRQADRFAEAGITLSFPPLEVLELAFDKGRTIELAHELGVPVPTTRMVADRAEIEDAAEAIGYPLVIKPRHSYYWTGSGFRLNGGPWYARDRAELQAALAEVDPTQPPPLLQAWVPGTGRGVFALLARDGTLSAAFAHQRIRDVHPSGSASVVRSSVALDPALLERAVSLLRAMGMWGLAMVEFRVDSRSGEALLLEVNARLWGSIQLAIDAGVDFPRLLVEVTEGRTPRVRDYRTDVVVRWWLGDLLRTIRVLRGRPRGFPGAFPRREEALRDFLLPRPRGMLNEVLRRDDPVPALGELAWAALRRG
jgi:predicted ATP-grasp superfamily ATP-dependent carboligase